MLRRPFSGGDANGRDGVVAEEAAGPEPQRARIEPSISVPEQPSAALARPIPVVPETVVSAEAIWEGKLVTESNVRVEGTLHGEVHTPGSLHVAAHARIDGTIMAREIVLAGEIEGQVRCRERLELLAGSSLSGDIETVTLVVHEGAFIEANRFKMSKIEPPGRSYR